jgi:hypothetical protein
VILVYKTFGFKLLSTIFKYELYTINIRSEMATTKRVKRNVIGITKSRELTQQGNPRDYWYVLDCGHTTYEHHTSRIHLQYMMINEVKNHTFPITKFCDKCQRNKPVDQEQTAEILGWFRASELNNKVLEMYKKFKPQVK